MNSVFTWAVWTSGPPTKRAEWWELPVRPWLVSQNPTMDGRGSAQTQMDGTTSMEWREERKLFWPLTSFFFLWRNESQSYRIYFVALSFTNSDIRDVSSDLKLEAVGGPEVRGKSSSKPRLQETKSTKYNDKSAVNWDEQPSKQVLSVAVCF